jgi:hypothetical protein
MEQMPADELFLGCRFNASADDGFSKGGANYETQHLTLRVEMSATLISLILCSVFFLIYGLVRHHGTAPPLAAATDMKLLTLPNRRGECCESCRNRLRRVYAWDRSTDHYLIIASLATMQGLAFFLGASADQPFQPMNMTNTTCRAQGVLFQFSVSGLNAAVIAELVDMYLVMVKAVPVAEIRKQYTPGLILFVFVVAAVYAVVPLGLQYALGASPVLLARAGAAVVVAPALVFRLLVHPCMRM